MQAVDNADEDGFLTYTPHDPSGKLIGSAFTSFFLASVVNQTINGIRLTKVTFPLQFTPLSSVVWMPYQKALNGSPLPCAVLRSVPVMSANVVATSMLHVRCNAYVIQCSERECRAQGLCTAQGNYTVNAGSNPVSHLWVLCNPDIPRRSPFVLDLAGSKLMFEV